MKHLSYILCIVLLIGILVCLPSCTENGTVSMTYTFGGAHAKEAGYAQGTITLTPVKDNPRTSGYYLLYFANQNGLLAAYDEFASIPITGDTVTHTVKDGTLLPPAATTLAVFESDAPFLDEQPAYDTRTGVLSIPRKKRLALPKADYTFGAVSDVHMNYTSYGFGPYEKWEAALNFFAAQQMNDIIVTGDMTGDESEGTLVLQYKTYRDIINASSYPLEHVFEGLGNHGNTKRGRQQFVQFTSGEGEERPEENSPWFSVLREGDTRDHLFLFMAQELKAPAESAAYDNFSKEQIDWVEAMLTQYASTDTDIFLILHSPFLNYGAGDRHPGDYTAMVTFKDEYPQTMRLKTLLETHKQVIVLSGHTHLSLYEGENYSDENGTSCRMVHVPSTCRPTTYHNETETLAAGDGRHTVNETYGSEAYTVAVYEKFILFTGHNLTTGTIIPSACYILPTTV